MLYRNDVFIERSPERKARVLDAYPARNEVVTFDLSESNALPVIESLSDLLERERRGFLAVEKGLLAPINENRASSKAQARRDTAWARIEPLISAQPAIYARETRFSLVEERAREMKCSVVTILKDLRRYWAGGQTKTALLGKFHLCGYKAPGHLSSAGRKPHLSDYKIFRIKPTDEANIRETIERVYLKAGGLTAATVTDAYQRMLEQHYSYNDGNGTRTINELGDRPTLRQYTTVLHKHYPLENIIRRRKGNSEFERDYAPKTGSVKQDCLGVGHIYEIDATIADVFLVSSHDRSRIIGKPTLYLVIDRRSRLIVGFYVGLEAASWPAAMHAILSISEDKAALCARNGVDYSADDWPADAVYPEMFLADRGEMISRDSSLVVNGLKITVGNLPRQRPDYKPIVECGFKLVHREMVDSVPGYEPPDNVFKRQGKRFDKDASLTLDEFVSILIKIIITHNRSPMPNYPLPVESMSRGIRAIPCEIWDDEAPTRMGSLTRFAEDYVRFSLLPMGTATITRGGISFNGCYYSTPEAFENGWFVKSGKGISSIDISYDRRLVDAIYIHDAKDPTKFCIARLLDKSSEYKGLSYAEVEAYETMKRKLGHSYEQLERQQRSNYHAHVDPIAKRARTETKIVSKGKSRSARKADIVVDRTEERRIRRQEEAVMPSAHPSENTFSGSPTNVLATQTLTTPEQAPTESMSLAEKLKMKRMEMQNGIS
ncbi:Mu transposase, C-terminal [Collimonas sp. OK307]|nr:Mu transposase, C-terminal [Collimonas sp. OK307]